MPPKKRTFNDFTSNPNAPTKANVAKRKRNAVKKQDREILQSRGVVGLTQKMKGDEPTLYSPYTKEELIEDFVYIDKDDPFEVITTMLGAGWAAKTNKIRKKLKKMGISLDTFKGQKQLKKQLKKKHKGKKLKKPAQISSKTDPDQIIRDLDTERIQKLSDKGSKKFEKQINQQIKTSFKKVMDDVDREVQKRHPDVSPEEWALWEKESTRGMLGSKTPMNRYGHGKGIGKAIARATGGTAKDANRLARKLQKSDEAIKRQLKADKEIARKKAQKNILKSKANQQKMKKAGRKQAGSLERGLPRVISPRYDPLKQYSARQN